MRVSVTSEHLSRGRRGSPCSCPVALAIGDAHPGTWSVTGPFAYLTTDELYGKEHFRSALTLVYVLPPDVTDRVVRLDRGEQVAPFEFEVQGLD